MLDDDAGVAVEQVRRGARVGGAGAHGAHAKRDQDDEAAEEGEQTGRFHGLTFPSDPSEALTVAPLSLPLCGIAWRQTTDNHDKRPRQAPHTNRTRDYP